MSKVKFVNREKICVSVTKNSYLINVDLPHSYVFREAEMRNSMLSQILEQGARARCELNVDTCIYFFLRRDGNESFNLIGS